MELDFLTLLDGIGTLAFALTGCLVAARKRTDLIGFLVSRHRHGRGRRHHPRLRPGPHPRLLGARSHAPHPLLHRGFGQFLAAERGDGLAAPHPHLGGRGRSRLLRHRRRRRDAGHGRAWFIAVLLGTITGVGGGLVRDMLAGEPTLVLRHEIYASACVLGILAYVAQTEGWLGVAVPRPLALWDSVALCFGVRAWAILTRFELAGYGEKKLARRSTDA